jgi:hypothetical protein
MLGYVRPQEPPKGKDDNKRLTLLIQNLENIVALLKEEVSVEEPIGDNVIRFDDMIRKIEQEIDETEYEEED